MTLTILGPSSSNLLNKFFFVWRGDGAALNIMPDNVNMVCRNPLNTWDDGIEGYIWCRPLDFRAILYRGRACTAADFVCNFLE